MHIYVNLSLGSVTTAHVLESSWQPGGHHSNRASEQWDIVYWRLRGQAELFGVRVSCRCMHISTFSILHPSITHPTPSKLWVYSWLNPCCQRTRSYLASACTSSSAVHFFFGGYRGIGHSIAASEWPANRSSVNPKFTSWEVQYVIKIRIPITGVKLALRPQRTAGFRVKHGNDAPNKAMRFYVKPGEIIGNDHSEYLVSWEHSAGNRNSPPNSIARS